MRLRNLRRFGYTIAIDVDADDDGARHFDLAAIRPRQAAEPLGTVTLTADGSLLSAWNRTAAEIGLIDGSLFQSGVHHALRALAAAIDGVPLPEWLGFRPHPDWAYRLPSAELEASV